MTTLTWGPASVADLDAVAALARECLEHDGGLPTLDDPVVVRTLLLGQEAIAGRDELGEVVAVAALSRDSHGRLVASGLVHPAVRRQGYGQQLVAWCRERAGAEPLRVIAESVAPEADALFAEAGMVRTAAEAIMRHGLRDIPVIARPDGVRSKPYTPETQAAFHEAYRHSFVTRPGFPDTPAAQWHSLLAEDPHFRPQDSRVLLTADGHPIAFVVLSGSWIDQVGVVPAWRGRGIGAHLVVRSLTALERGGAQQAWLAVAVDNPARELYERLGFEHRGLRARYASG